MNFPKLNLRAYPRGVRPSSLFQRVSGVLLRRAAYLIRLAYWTVRHRSVRHVKWILSFEGAKW